MDAIKLNIGAGSTKLDGFIPIDRKLGTEAYPLPAIVHHGSDTIALTDGSVDEIRASHVLEHFGFNNALRAIGDWVRVLKPGGKLRLAVPDMDRIMELRKSGDPLWRHYLMGGQTDTDDFHNTVYDRDSLAALMKEVGLENIEEWRDSERIDNASHKCTLNLQGTKDGKPKQRTVNARVAAITSVPRLGINSAWGCTFDALMPFRIPLYRATGAFWGHALQNLMEDHAEKLDWLLTIDYDSIFTRQHLDHLFQVFDDRRDMDALAALQCRREKETPLMCIGSDVPNAPKPVDGIVQIELEPGSPLRVSTAHFGLTLIRVEKLRKLPRPWFMSIPNASGSYNDDRAKEAMSDRIRDLRRWAEIPDENVGRLDDDIWFWHIWRLAGNTVYVDHECRIGHGEETVSYYDEDMKRQQCSMQDWRKISNMNPEVRR